MTENNAVVYAGGGQNSAISDIISRYISVTVVGIYKIALSLLLMATRNHVWSNNGDIANDLE